ncbi:MAG: PD-(D/E)XK nuclease family protein [Rickettsiales bacterium]|jgi:ATP-dependent helicase/nuclease subunit B|nr:PD-(D/E)XK nuclease family protein [Rickettsiales bacterium]
MTYQNGFFCCTNPAKILDGLWQLMGRPFDNDYSRDLIFVPSRRSAIAIEEMLVEKTGGAVLLPKLVPLGTGVEESDDLDAENQADRVFVAARRIQRSLNCNLSLAISITNDLIHIIDYLDTEEMPRPDFHNLISGDFAHHFSQKADLFDIVAELKDTDARKRVRDIRSWLSEVQNPAFFRVFACGSTGSIPATRDLLVKIASLSNGFVLLPGKIAKMPGNLTDLHPYNAEAKLLAAAETPHSSVRILDTGESNADFMNLIFQPDLEPASARKITLTECDSEASEMTEAANIINDAAKSGKSVLAISPDVSASYRLSLELGKLGIEADLSIGQPATMLPISKLIISILRLWTGENDKVRAAIAILKNGLVDARPNLDEFIKERFRDRPGKMQDILEMDPKLSIAFIPPENNFANSVFAAVEYLCPNMTPDNADIWRAVVRAGVLANGSIFDFAALFEFIAGGIKIRNISNPLSRVRVLGTIEARMVPTDVVVICGLNEGFFPKRGFSHPWLPGKVADAIGLPAAERKTGLMAMDFINLSCNAEVFWTRSKRTGGASAIKSRFLTRAEVFAETSGVQLRNAGLRLPDFAPELISAPRPPATFDPVSATALDTFVHNPFEFYAKHILRLRPMEAIRTGADNRDYGILLHSLIENGNPADFDMLAAALAPMESATFYFWKKRFAESLPLIEETIKESAGAKSEISGAATIARRRITARADRIWDGVVMDIKTGRAPSAKSMTEGNSPQVPITAYILESGGFTEFGKTKCREMRILDLKTNKNHIYTDPAIIIRAVERVKWLFEKYSVDGAEYPNLDGEAKYHTCDHLSRQ